MKTNPYHTAFPFFCQETNIQEEGLSKREFFAAMALAGQAVSAIPGSHNQMTNASFAKERAQAAVILADALIQELSEIGGGVI